MAGIVVVIATDLRPEHAAWARAEAQAAGLQEFTARTFGMTAQVVLACLPARSIEDPGPYHIGQVIDRSVGEDTAELFILPVAFDLNVWQRTLLGEELSAARRRHAALSIHHDAVDPTHAFLVECFASQILQVLQERHILPQQAGLHLVADGRGDPATRADSYRLMRLLWEQAGLGWAEVGFVRHTQPFLPTVLKRCLSEPRGWLLVPQCQWDGELTDYAAVMLADHQRAASGSGRVVPARPAAGSPRDPGLARTASRPPLARQACPSGRARSLRQISDPIVPGRGLVR
jgi:hypothetical protein